ncbi:MAG: hypothetical protein AAF549_08750 [Pseudomonadota bacterium]
MDKRRKHRSVQRGKFFETVIRNVGKPDQVVITHSGSSVELLIERNQNGIITVSDERGISVTSQHDHHEKIKRGRLIGPFAAVANIGHNLKKPKPDELEIERLGITIKVFNTGEKEVIFHEQGTSAKMGAFTKDPNSEYDIPLTGTRLYRLGLEAPIIEDLSVDYKDLPPYLTLLLARDYDLQSDIFALNEVDPIISEANLEQAWHGEFDEEWSGPEEWRPQPEPDYEKAKLAEKEWHDVTEFRGHRVDVPKNFRIMRQKSSYFVTTDFDRRDRIINLSAIYNHITEEGSPTSRFISETTSPYSLLRILHKSQSFTAPNGDQWLYVVFESPEAAKITNALRQSVKAEYGLGGNEFGAINFARGKSFIAIREDMMDGCFKKSIDAVKGRGVIDPAKVI